MKVYSYIPCRKKASSPEEANFRRLIKDQKAAYYKKLSRDADGRRAAKGEYEATCLIYADWLEERGRHLEAVAYREKGGQCRVSFQLYDKDTGHRVGRRSGSPSTIKSDRARISDLHYFRHVWDAVVGVYVDPKPKDRYEIRVVVEWTQVVGVLPEEGKG